LSLLQGSPHFPRLVIDGSKKGFVVEEQVSGIPYSSHTKSLFRKNLKKVAQGLAQALTDLTSRHPAIVHRDIKMKHLLFDFINGRVVLIDFGSAEFEGSRLPNGRRSFYRKLGRRTHVFQPFEQLTEQHSQDRRIDVFAAASLLYSMILDEFPYDNSVKGFEQSWEYYQSRERRIESRLSILPPKVARAFINALKADPNERSRDLWELANAIRETDF